MPGTRPTEHEKCHLGFRCSSQQACAAGRIIAELLLHCSALAKQKLDGAYEQLISLRTGVECFGIRGANCYLCLSRDSRLQLPTDASPARS